MRHVVSGLALFAVVLPGVASAQVNCSAAPRHEARADCYNRLSQIYRDESNAHYGAARDLRNTHDGVGAAMGTYGELRGVGTPDGLIATYGSMAWEAPNIYYNYRYGPIE